MAKVFRFGTGLANYMVAIVSVALAASLATTIWVFVAQNIHKENFNQHLSDASELQVLAHQIAKYAVESGSGIESSFQSLEKARDRSASLMTALKDGSPERNLPPSPEEIRPTLLKVDAAWQDLETHVNSILLSQTVIVRADEIVGNMKSVLPNFKQIVGIAADQLVGKGTNTQVYHATNLLYIAQRIDTNLGEVLEGGLTTVFALDQLTQNTDKLEIVVTALTEGDKALGVKAVKNKVVRESLLEILRQLDGIRVYRDELLGMIAELLPALSTLGAVDDEETDDLKETGGSSVLTVASENLASLDVELMGFYSSAAGQVRLAGVTVGSGFAIALVVISTSIFLFLSYLIVYQARAKEREVSEQNESNQAAIRKLLREMGNLANGDLSIEATVTEDITGAIADSINASVESMRDVVFSINDTSEKVSSAADKNQSTIRELVVAAEQQDKDLVGATEVSKSMAETLQVMASKAEVLAEVATNSLELAEKGGGAAHKNINGMGVLREQIQGTSKRIKRLGESSQEIGSIVGLINGITDQTNILAMNASMQAAAAGDAGRGFSIVADEVQRLAERSGRATKQIETLVSAIQADTSEAVASMELSIGEVLNGTGLAEEAGRALDDIQKASNQVTKETMEMVESAKHQSEQASGLRETMHTIQEITDQMSEGISSTANGIVYQADNVLKLRNSVTEFTLPEEQ